MTSIPEKYPEIPSLLLSSIVACVGVDKLDMILDFYDTHVEIAANPYTKDFDFSKIVRDESAEARRFNSMLKSIRKEIGKQVVLSENVKYVGEGDDPAQDPLMIAYEKALKEYYKPTL